MNLLPCPFCGEIPYHSIRDDTCRCNNIQKCRMSGIWFRVSEWQTRKGLPDLQSAYNQFKTGLIAQEETNAHLRNLCRMLVAEEMLNGYTEAFLDLLNKIKEAVKL